MELGYIFTWTVSIVGTACGWAMPIVGLFVYYMLAMLRPPYTWFWVFNIYDMPRFSLYVAASTVLGWLLAGFGEWKGLRSIRWPLLGMIIYVGWGALISQFWAISPGRAWQALDPLWKILLMMLATVTLVRDARQIKAFTWMITLTLAFLAYNFNDLYLQNNLYLWLNGWGGVDNNGVAMIMVMAVPPLFFMGIHTRKWWLKPICLAGMLFACHTVLFTYSRGGQLGLIMVGIVIFIIALVKLPNKAVTIAVALIAVWITLDLAGPLVRERFRSIFVDKSERDASAESRFSTWQGGWDCMKANPLGVGPRNFNLVSQNYGLPVNKSVHNLFLQTGADFGFPGLFGLCLFYIGSVWTCWKMMRTRIARRLKWPVYYGTMVLVSISGFLVCSTFIGMESVEIGYILCMIGLCTVAHVDRLRVSELAESGKHIPEFDELGQLGTDLVPA